MIPFRLFLNTYRIMILQVMRYLFRRNAQLAEKCEMLLRLNPSDGKQWQSSQEGFRPPHKFFFWGSQLFSYDLPLI